MKRSIMFNKLPKHRKRQPQYRLLRQRYRGRICCFPPETFIALSFFILLPGVSLLLIYRFCGLSEKDVYTIFKLAGFFIVLGWALYTYVCETTRYRSITQLDSELFAKPSFVGVCIPPQIHQEWLSAQLLPAMNREWVPGETLPGYEPYRGEFVQPPTRSASPTRHDQQPPSPARHDQQPPSPARRDQQPPSPARRDQQPPVSKKKRNRQK